MTMTQVVEAGPSTIRSSARSADMSTAEPLADKAHVSAAAKHGFESPPVASGGEGEIRGGEKFEGGSLLPSASGRERG